MLVELLIFKQRLELAKEILRGFPVIYNIHPTAGLLQWSREDWDVQKEFGPMHIRDSGITLDLPPGVPIKMAGEDWISPQAGRVLHYENGQTWEEEPDGA